MPLPQPWWGLWLHQYRVVSAVAHGSPVLNLKQDACGERWKILVCKGEKSERAWEHLVSTGSPGSATLQESGWLEGETVWTWG